MYRVSDYKSDAWMRPFERITDDLSSSKIGKPLMMLPDIVECCGSYTYLLNQVMELDNDIGQLTDFMGKYTPKELAVAQFDTFSSMLEQINAKFILIKEHSLKLNEIKDQLIAQSEALSEYKSKLDVIGLELEKLDYRPSLSHRIEVWELVKKAHCADSRVAGYGEAYKNQIDRARRALALNVIENKLAKPNAFLKKFIEMRAQAEANIAAKVRNGLLPPPAATSDRPSSQESSPRQVIRV